jgi:hypothetical protein
MDWARQPPDEPLPLTDRHMPEWSLSGFFGGDRAAGVTVPLPFEQGAGGKLFFVGHATPKKYKIGLRVISSFSCKIDLWYHSRIWSQQMELFVF